VKEAPMRALAAAILMAIAVLPVAAQGQDESDTRGPAAPVHVFLPVGKPELQWPARQDGRDRVCYAGGKTIQLSATTAGLLAGRYVVGVPVIDLTGGSDLVIFDDLRTISPANAVPLSRSGVEDDPITGKRLLMVKYGIRGGFVPLGAKLADGRPHPHAGTGFGLLVVHGFPPDHSDLWAAGRRNKYIRLELQQYRYDGTTFSVVSTKKTKTDALVPGWTVTNGSLTNAVPDGEDFLLGLVAARPGARRGAGISRWRREDGAWRPVDFVPATGADGSFEQSIVRDTNGDLLLCARGTQANTRCRFLVWRSTDNGKTWARTIDLPNMCASSPVSIGRTVGGALFIAANPYCKPYKNGVGRMVRPVRWRETLALWPLTPGRTGVCAPTFSFTFGHARYGPSPRGSALWADHPTVGVIRLADGCWHAVLCMRVWARDEVGNQVLETPQSGCWIKEIHTINDGPVVPEWQF